MVQDQELTETARRLEAEYQDRFAGYGGGFSVYGTRFRLGAEVLFGRRGGPATSASYAMARRRWLFGPAEAIRTISEAEVLLRETLDGWLRRLAHGERPTAIPRRWRPARHARD